MTDHEMLLKTLDQMKDRAAKEKIDVLLSGEMAREQLDAITNEQIVEIFDLIVSGQKEQPFGDQPLGDAPNWMAFSLATMLTTIKFVAGMVAMGLEPEDVVNLMMTVVTASAHAAKSKNLKVDPGWEIEPPWLEKLMDIL